MSGLFNDYVTLTGDSPYQRWLLEEVRGGIGERVLDVGTGIGGWLPHLADRELVVCMDISGDCIRHAERYHPAGNAVFVEMDICDDEVLDLVGHRFDTVLCINTLEHIEDDERAISNMHALLSDGGRLMVVVPAHPELFGTLDERYGHHRRYRRSELRSRLLGAGFSLERLDHFNLFGAAGWLFYGRLLRLNRTPSAAFGAFNRLVPFLRRVDRALGPPLGLSLVAMARK